MQANFYNFWHIYTIGYFKQSVQHNTSVSRSNRVINRENEQTTSVVAMSGCVRGVRLAVMIPRYPGAMFYLCVPVLFPLMGIEIRMEIIYFHSEK